MAEQFAGTWSGDTHKKFAQIYREMLETGDYKYDPEAQQVKNAIDYKYEQLNHEGKRHLYTVQIPGDNGHNYLPYGEEIPHEDAMKIKAALRARLLSDPNSGYTAKIADILDDELNQAFSYMGGETILGTLDAYLGNDGVGLKSTRFLHELGYTGIKVPTNYGDPHGDHSANNYVVFDPKDARIMEHVRYSKLNEWPAEDKEQSRVRFSKVTDQKLLDELEKGETEVGYRNVVMKPDGTLGSPMADKLGKKGQKSVRTTPFAFNEWEQAEENPDMATDDGKINLIKPDGLGSVESVDYNPYIHIRPSKINKQFTQAWKRDNLIYVETLYPTSELKGEYHAEKAALSVGRHEWTNGDLILSRWDKPLRIVPWEEVADEWVEEFKDRGVTFDIVPPGLLPVLVERGVEILPPKIAAGAPAREAYVRWRNRGRNVRFSKTNENERIFISNAEDAVNAISMEKATPEQWLKMIEGKGGLKAGEDKWIGLSDWLRASDRKTLTKQEVAEFIAQNQIQIEEAKYSETPEEFTQNDIYSKQEFSDLISSLIDYDEDGNPYVLSKEFDELSRNNQDFRDGFYIDNWGEGIYVSDPDAAARYLGLTDEKVIDDTRLAYTTDGLDNKREIALTVPNIEPWNKNDEIHFGDAGNGRAIAWIRFGQTVARSERGKLREAVSEARHAVQTSIPGFGNAKEELANAEKALAEYDAAHPGESSGKKVLVIDEIQSKRHQEGREKGYKDNSRIKEIERRFAEIEKRKTSIKQRLDEIDRLVPDDVKGVAARRLYIVKLPEFEEDLQLHNEYNEIVSEENRLINESLIKDSGIPAAPFEKNWHELAMKRMLRLAAEEGYDYVAWTTGEQQAERYNLSDKVDEIKVADSYDNTFTVIGIKDGGILVQKDVTGEHGIAEMIGKDLARKAYSNLKEGRTEYLNEDGAVSFSGDNLKIGGQGMSGFYDEILPRFMNKYGKKWGVSVADIELPFIYDETGHPATMHAVPVTDEMKRSVMKGQVMFSKTNRTESIFISNAEQAAERIKMDKATPEQWLKMLEKEGGLKAREDKWIGLSDFIKSSDRKTLTKQEILDYIRNNEIQIEETHYSENVDIESATKEDIKQRIGHGKELEELQDEIDFELRLAGEEVGEMDQEDIDQWITEQMTEKYGDDFVYGYFIQDGFINYNIDPFYQDIDEFNESVAGDEKKINDTRLLYTTEGLENKHEIALTVPTIGSYNESDNVHFGDADNGRAVAWVRFGDAKVPYEHKEFDETLQKAKKDNGIVRIGLADTQFPIVSIERHPFEGRGKDAIRKAREWAEDNLVGEHTYHEGEDDSFVYAITGGKDGSIGKFLSQSSTGNSENLGLHLATLMRLPEIIDKSIDVEIHPSYKKVDNVRSIANGIDSDEILIHRLYGAIELDGNIYRVKTTMNEHRSSQNEAHDYRVTKVELLESNPTKETGAHVSGSSTSNAQGAPASISGAKLLENVEKSYDSGKKLLTVSKKPLFSKLSRDVEDIVNDGKMRVSAENDEARAHLNERMMSIDKNLAKLRMAASAQREYDRETVRSITDLAKRLLDEGALSDPTRQEIEKMLTVTRWATGRKDLDGAVDAIMDLMVGNQLRHAKGVFDGLLKIRGSKVDARGVEVQGKLDAPGQRMMQVFKDAMDMAPEAIEDHIAAAEERLDSPDDAVKAAAGDELVGLRMAREYAEDIRASIDEEKGIKNELRQAAEDRRAGKMSLASYREFVASCDEALRQNRMDRINAYNSLTGRLSGKLYESIARGTAFREEEKQRIERIHHFANSDLAGQKSDEHGNKNDRLTNNGIFRFLLKPLATFDQMLRHFGSKSVNGEGYLWNHFMRGWVDANDAEFQGMKAATDALDRKVSDVFGRKMRWSDLYSVERKMPTVSVKFWDGGKMQDHELTQGNLLYIYMVNKMSDGRMKLRRMGIEEEHVNAIKEQMDPRFIELADWLQSDFLVNIRNKYNRVHEKLFGAPMAAIENYFPLKVLANARVREVDMATPDLDGTTPATITGSIIKRRKNALALDVIGTDAFSLVIEHLQQMEHWAAFAPFNQDLNTLLSYKTFRNRVQNMSSIYGAGSIIWENFRKSAEIAAGVYRPSVSRDSIDTAAVNIAKGVTAAKISFRVYTAIKQLLSMPAFISDANAGQLIKSMATPWVSWNWAMDELPGFQKRWLSKQVGDTRLMKTDSDWKMWRNKWVKTASRLGMSPNAFVDALTVAVGAKAMYETRKNKYIEDGYSEEQADKRAKQDATILFNETQQSNEAAFLSSMQLDRTWASVALTVFRNSSMGYQRQLVDAVRNLGRKLRPDYKDVAVEFMSKQMVRDGVDEQDARDAAERNYRKSTFRDALRVALFGFVMQFAWNLGKYLPYLIAGDDDDEKKKMLKDAARQGLLGGTVEGLSGGSVISEAANLLASGKGLKNYDPSLMPVVSDIQRIINMASYDQVAAANEVVNLLIQAGVGVNPQTLTDIGVAIYDASHGDLETSKEATLLLMRILQCPQSQLDKVFADEMDLTAEKGLDLTIGEFAERYANYKVRRGAPLTGWAYSDELKEKRINAYEKRFTKQAQELIRTRGNDIDRAYYDYVDTEHKEVDATLRDLRSGIRTSAQSGDQMGAMEYAQMLNDFMQTPEFQRYSKAHGNINAIKRLQTALKSADGNSRDAIEDQILQLKKQMVDELKRTDNK